MNRLALFDLDQTLTERDVIFGEWASTFVAAHGLPADAVGVLVELDADGYGDKHAMFQKVANRFELSLNVEQEVVGYYADLIARHRITRFVGESLRMLRRANWRIGIVTNGSATQLDKVRVTGLDRLVDAVAVSGIEDVRKPDTRLFDIAARRAGAVTADGWMVGDNPEADIQGGADAGMRTVWMSRGRRWEVAGLEPDHVAESIPHAVALMLATDTALEPIRRRAVRAFVTDGRGSVLLLEVQDPARPDRGRYLTTPGGGVESGESDQEALRRELAEETGVTDVTIGAVAAEFTHTTGYMGYPVIQEQRIYDVRTEAAPPSGPAESTIEHDTHVGLRWWSHQELLREQHRLHETVRQPLLDLLAKQD